MFALTRETLELLRRPDPYTGAFTYGTMVLFLPVVLVLDVLALPIVLLGMGARRALAQPAPLEALGREGGSHDG